MLIDFRKLFPKYNLKFSGVLHLGANTGEEAPIYKELGIMKQIWFEANEEIFLKLKSNISDNPDAVAFNFAVGDENKEAVLHVSNNGSQSSSVLELGLHKEEHPDVKYVSDMNVQMVRLDSFDLDLSNVDLLNVDVQGFELNVLRGMGDLLHQFKALYLEVNKKELYENCALIEDIDFYVSSFGFQRVETYWAPNKSWGDALYIKGI